MFETCSVLILIIYQINKTYFIRYWKQLLEIYPQEDARVFGILKAENVSYLTTDDIEIAVQG